MFKQVSIVITNWNGRFLLEKCIPSVIDAVGFYGDDNEIIVVDDASTDDSLDFLKSNYPQIKVVELNKNSGFGVASNLGVENSRNSLVILLNNDVIVSKNFIGPLVKHFSADDVFAVGPKVLWEDENKKEVIYFGKGEADFRFGLLKVKQASEIKCDRKENFGLSLFAGGGFAALDKKKFLEIGGFDKIYYPFYVEDLDLSYCAWKRGWKVLYEPESVVYHKHQSTIGAAFDRNFIECMAKKNIIIFAWKNITDVKMMIKHVLFLFLRLFWWTITGKFVYVRAVRLAYRQLHEVLAARSKVREQSCRSDKQILKTINSGLLDG